MNLPWLSRTCASGPAAPASPSACVLRDTPRAISTWLEGAPLTALLDGRTDALASVGENSTVALRQTWRGR